MIFFSLAGFTVRIQCMIHVICKIPVNQPLVLSVKLTVNRRLLVVKFWGKSKVTCGFLTEQGVGALNPQVVQESTVLLMFILCVAGVQPRWIQGIRCGDGVSENQETTA